MTHPHTPGTPIKAYGWAALLGALAVTAIAAAASWSHMVGVALAVGERSWVAAILPASVDGLLITAVCTLALDKANGLSPRWSARIAAGIGVSASLAANIAHANPTWGARAVAGWPALALFLTIEMLTRRGRLRQPQMSTPADVRSTDIRVDKPQLDDVSATDIISRPVSAPKSARVSALAERFPNATATELAALARTSDRTVRRTLSRTDKVNGAPFLADAEALPGGAR